MAAPDELHEWLRFQRRVGRALLLWGGLSAVAGAVAQASGSALIRQAGVQAIVWGGIDAAIALVGLRDARARYERGEDVADQARRFRLIVLANAVLDIGYVAGGAWLVRGARGRPERAGMGFGIILQGIFLLLFDTTLALLSGQYIRPGQRAAIREP